MIFAFTLALLAQTTSTTEPPAAPVLTLDQAVSRARDAASAKDGPDALEIEAKRREDGDIEFDAVRVGVEHRSVDHFFAPEIDNNTGLPFSAADGLSLSATVPLPRLDDIVRSGSADLRADAARAGLKENARDLARDVRRLVVEIAALKRERALLATALTLAQQREALLNARRQSEAATIIDVDEAGRERLAVAADALGVDDDLQKARDDLSALLNDDVDADDDLEARCQAPLPPLDEALAQARQNDPRHLQLRLLDDALAHDELAGWLGYAPWPNRVDGLVINRDDGRQDVLRFGVSFDIPLLHFLDGENDAITLRRQANAGERAVVDARLTRQVQQAHHAVTERRKMVEMLALPPPTAMPDDAAVAGEIELHRNLAERRRLRAIARCARAVVDVLSLE